MNELDEKYMRRALNLAEQGKGHTNPNPMVGAVIVKDGRIIGEGYHRRCGEGHAEVNAFASCREDPEGATLYVTLEPCSHYGKTPPCADLVVSKKVGRVVIGSLDPNPLVAGRGVKKLEEAGIQVESGCLSSDNEKLNEIFLHYIREKNPFVLMKMAMSLDGKIATYTGESQWISSEESRAHSQTLRNQYMAILVGIGTVLADDPSLTCRMPGGENPLRIILDSGLRIPENSKALEDQDKAPTLIAVTEAADSDKIKRLKDRGVEILVTPIEDGEVDIKYLVKELGIRGIDSILVEGGGSVHEAFMKSGEVDKVISYVAPIIIGGEGAKGAVAGQGYAHLSEALHLEDFTAEALGPDICITGRVKRTCSQES